MHAPRVFLFHLADGGPLNRLTRARILLRSLWLQASWSFEGLQALGFCWAMEPALDEFYGEEGPERVEATRRYTETFNTHPFFAPALLGCALRLEERGEGGRVKDIWQVAMGPFGGLGDSFFWGGLKPFLAAAAVLALLLGIKWAPLVFLLVWLTISIYTRILFFQIGYLKGEEGITSLLKTGFLPLSGRMKLYGSAILGGAAGVMAFKTSSGVLPESLLILAAAGAGTLALSSLAKRGVDPVRVLLLSTIIFVLLGLVK